ncbi:MAG: hypothetical protein ACJ795_16880 [Ktedonobacteraceae bacterium]
MSTLNDSLNSGGRHKPEEGMMVEAFLILLIIVIALDVAALRWGVDSTEGVNSPEWERRQQWPAFH